MVVVGKWTNDAAAGATTDERRLITYIPIYESSLSLLSFQTSNQFPISMPLEKFFFAFWVGGGGKLLRALKKRLKRRLAPPASSHDDVCFPQHNA